jgi:hypothetical protein
MAAHLHNPTTLPPVHGDPFPSLTEKYTPKSEPVKHPPFVASDTIDGTHTMIERLVREALRQAFELTPWEKAVVLQIRREDFSEVAEAVAVIAGPVLGKRVFITTVHREDKRQAKRIMIDPRSGTEYLKGTPPWGEAPAPEVESSEPPVATIGTTCPQCGLAADGPGLVLTDMTICTGPDGTLHSRPDDTADAVADAD